METSRTQQARQIWQAGLDAVRSDLLIQQNVTVGSDYLELCGHRWPLSKLGRIEVIGAGKAGAGMAEGFESALGPEILGGGDWRI